MFKKSVQVFEGFVPPLIKENYHWMMRRNRNQYLEEEERPKNVYILNSIPILFYINFFISIFFNITKFPEMNGGELLLRALLAGIFDIFYLGWFILDTDSRTWLASFKK